MSDAILEVKELRKHFPVHGGFWGRVEKWVKAVDGVSLEVRRGETLGLVGESGCGKTTLGKCLVRLIEPTSGEIVFRGRDILKLPPEAVRALRSELQIVYQDPRSSLDPRMTVRELVAEGLRVHARLTETEITQKVSAALRAVGLSERDARRFPHMFSGGQQQRIAIARTLALNPQFIVLDEPTSALDVSIQATLLNLLKRLQREFQLTYIVISHDIRAIRALADRVAVMYLGRIVEQGPTARVLDNPVHPYTQALLAAVPTPDPSRPIIDMTLLTGDVPDPSNVPSGCPFHPRCPMAEPICRSQVPHLMPVEERHSVACPPGRQAYLRGAGPVAPLANPHTPRDGRTN